MNRDQIAASILKALTDLGIPHADNGQSPGPGAKWWSAEALAQDLAGKIIKQAEEGQLPGQQHSSQEHAPHGECCNVQRNEPCCTCHAIDALTYLITTADKTTGSAVWESVFMHMRSQYIQNNPHPCKVGNNGHE